MSAVLEREPVWIDLNDVSDRYDCEFFASSLRYVL